MVKKSVKLERLNSMKSMGLYALTEGESASTIGGWGKAFHVKSQQPSDSHSIFGTASSWGVH